MKRVKAYTLMEVTIAMLLAGIVIMITYTVYTIVIRAYGAYNRKNIEVATQLRLDELIKKDFAKSAVILRTDSGMVCKTESGAVIYKIAPALIIRTYGITDSFNVRLDNVTFSYEEKVIEAGKDSALIDGLRLAMRFRNDLNSYYYHKHYSAAELFKLNVYAVN